MPYYPAYPSTTHEARGRTAEYEQLRQEELGERVQHLPGRIARCDVCGSVTDIVDAVDGKWVLRLGLLGYKVGVGFLCHGCVMTRTGEV